VGGGAGARHHGWAMPNASILKVAPAQLSENAQHAAGVRGQQGRPERIVPKMCPCPVHLGPRLARFSSRALATAIFSTASGSRFGPPSADVMHWLSCPPVAANR